MNCLIYKISNTINDKIYIGQTWISLKKRFVAHCGKHFGYSIISRAINKYGKDKFTYKLITVCGTQETADYWETYFIKKYNSIILGYNICEGGSRGKASPSTKKKMSISATGKKRSEATKKKMSEAKKMSPGRKQSNDEKENRRLKMIGNTINQGRVRSPEIRKKISESLMGCKRSEESNNKSSIAHKGQKLSKETKAKISEFNKGRTWKLINGKRVWRDKEIL